MKFVVVALLLCAVCAQANLLPPGFESAEELASVLANEPAAASRFAEASAADTVTFGDQPGPVAFTPGGGDGGCGCGGGAPPMPMGGGGCNCGGDDGVDDDVSEFDAQIEQIERDIKHMKITIKETEECARRLREQEAELRALKDQRDHLEREKEKKILQAKLERQMRDLAEINRMSRSLRTKFSELKHTQKLIKTKMVGTRSSLNEIDAEPEVDAETLQDSAATIGKQVDAMHKSQLMLLSSAHARNSNRVKFELKNAARVHGQSIKAGNDGEAFLD